jgi:hypothetical protein
MNHFVKPEAVAVATADAVSVEELLRECGAHLEANRLCVDDSYVVDLIRVLLSHPDGLRRWSVMRAIRKNRENARLPIPDKIEDDVQRMFLQHCAQSDPFKKRNRPPETALFHWPQGKLAGLWAVFPDRAEAWMSAKNAKNFE